MLSRNITLALLLALLFIPAASADRSVVAIHYDDGTPDDGLWIGGARGHAVLFTSPVDNWTLSKISICGKIRSESGLYVVEIWDAGMNTIYSRTDVAGAYFDDNMSWVEIDIPDQQVTGSFFICVFEFSGIFVGADIGNETAGRSMVVSRNPNRIDAWDLQSPANRTDWMISAVGYLETPGPELTLVASEEPGGISITSSITDADHNLAGASAYVIDNSTGLVVWTDHKAIEGAQAIVSIFWPRLIFWITNGTSRVGPVLAVNLTGVPDNLSSYLAFSAPCLVTLAPGGPEIEALAYFGKDGTFHALQDLQGRPLYQSEEILAVLEPGRSYGDYMRQNISVPDSSSISFRAMVMGLGLALHEPVFLTRSPIQHYTLKLEAITAQPGDYAVEVVGEDALGNSERAVRTGFS